jgi:hypothetical protein
MNIFVTDKLIIVDENRKEINLLGPLKDKIQLAKNGTKNKDYFCKKYKLNLICKQPAYVKDRYSLIINNETLVDYAERLLYLLNILELSSCQLVHQKTFDLEVLQRLYTEDYQHDNDTLNCKLSNKDYENIINRLNSSDPLFTKSLLTLKDIRWIGESVRNELFHTDHCIQEMIHHAAIATNLHKKFHGDHLKSKTEHRIYNQSADAVYWNFCDAIKSLATSIDITISFLFYINTIEAKKRTKIKRIIYKDFTSLYKKIQDSFNFPYPDLNELSKKNNQLFLIRNELTHNQQIGNIRQPIFVGIGTSEINYLNLSYTDIMLWDFENENLCRSGGRCSFFKQKRNALLGLKTFSTNAIEFINAGLINSFFTLKTKLIESSINTISIPTNFTKQDLGIRYINLDLIKNKSDFLRILHSISIKSLDQLIQHYNAKEINITTR